MAKQIRFINEISLFLEKFPKILIPAIPGNSLSFPGMAGIGNESSHCCWINWPVFLGETLITSFYDNKHLVAPMGKTAILRSVTSRIQFSPVSNIFRNGILTISRATEMMKILARKFKGFLVYESSFWISKNLGEIGWEGYL